MNNMKFIQTLPKSQIVTCFIFLLDNPILSSDLSGRDYCVRLLC